MATRISSIPPVLIQPGGINQLGNMVKQNGGKSAFLITDKGLTATGLTDKVKGILEKAELSVYVYDEVVANPTVTVIDNGAKALKAFGPDPVVITLGGGSSMDAGKAIAVVAKCGDSILPFCFSPGFDEENKTIDRSTMAPKAFGTDGFKVIAVPTTSGTASETNGASVVTDDSGSVHRKLIFVSDFAKAQQIVLDAELCVGVPAYPTATCGMDVLTHATEAFASGRQNPYGDAIALGAIKLVAENLRATLADPTNVQLRQNMHLASHMAGVAFNISPLGIVHAMGHPLSAMYNQAHVQTLATLLPHLMRFNMPVRANKYAQVAQAFGVFDASKSDEVNGEAAFQAVIQLSNDVGTGKAIEEYDGGKFASDLDELTRQALTDISMLSTARQPTFADVQSLYKEAYSNKTMYMSSSKL